MKTLRDVFVTLDEEHDIRTSAMFYADLNEQITDEEYQRTVDLWVKIKNSDILDESDDDREDDL